MTTTNASKSVNPNPYRVLLIGDESVNRQMLIDLLRQRGHDVVKARSANEAEKALARRVDAVVVDQRVRGTNGLAWVRRLRGNGHTMPVVFCSTSNCSSKTYKTLLKVLGVSAIVHKPLVPVVLANQIESLLPGYDERPGPQIAAVDDVDSGELARDFTPEIVPMVIVPNTIEPDAISPPINEWQSEYDAEQETRLALEALGRVYISDVPEMLYDLRAQIAASMETEDKSESETLQLAITTAHQMRGTAGSLGFPELSRLAGIIEDLLKKSTDALLPEFTARALMVVAEIETWIECWQDSNQPPEQVTVLETTPEPVLSMVGEDTSELSVPHFSSRRRAIIVDNDRTRVEDLKGMLGAGRDLQLEALPCSVQVLTLLDQLEPSFLIIDSEGDGLSGFDICRMIRCHPRWTQLPVLMMTADAGVESRRAVYNCGATDFIVKPLLEDELRARLRLTAGSCEDAVAP